MKYIIITLLQFLSLSLFAQTFNSVMKPVSLNSVSTVSDDKKIARPAEDTTRILLPDSLPKLSIPHPRMDEQLKDDPPTIAFSKPLSYLQKTSKYGYRFHPILKRWRFHAGVDLASNADTVYSMLSGKIKDSGYSSTLGYYVRTEHSDGKLEVLYAHLSEYYYLKGDSLSAGEPIGITGSTGLSTGDHLHLGVYKEGRHVDPIIFMSQILNFNNHQINSSNERSKRTRDFGIDSDIRAGFANYSID